MELPDTPILKTLAYADIFDYPLTFIELERWLLGERVRDRVRIKKALDALRGRKIVDYKNGYFFLQGRARVVESRKKREEWSKEKWEIAGKTMAKLKWLPSIKLIGVTGALAMNNGEKEDDIDLLIITSRSALWLTRLAIFLLAPFLKIRRRKPGEQKVKNKICFNLFLEESYLKVGPPSLFLAHEICQMKPGFDKDRTYKRFLWENRWVKQYLPNAVSFNNETIEQSNNGLMVSLLHCFIAIFNKMSFFVQYQYMKPKMTSEKVSLHQAFFHPLNLQEKILARYGEKLKTIDN